jgi:heterodisulfide reductase subunit D
MDNFKIILFLCNWNPHAAFNTLQEKEYKIPPEVKMIRIPCTGRITKSLLFKAFEMGADGVALVGCKPGSCRYGAGTDNSINNTKDIQNILELVGIGKDRMCLATFLPHESEYLSRFLNDFCNNIKLMGKSPVTVQKGTPEKDNPEKLLTEIIPSNDVYACQDCGKCTSSCPIALSAGHYSPRNIVTSIIAGKIDSDKIKDDIWSCLTCGICYERCPSGVNFPEFIRELRCNISDKDDRSRYAHGGFFQSIMRSMTSPDLRPKRWKSLPSTIQTDPESKTLFFGGCAPYFDMFFTSLNNVQTSNILTDSLKLLNFFDIKPNLLNDERCCGHDLLWSGDKENFLKLAKLNVDQINNLGIRELITACPECYKTIKYDYPKYGIKPDFKVTHIYEFLEQEIDRAAVVFNKFENRITYQDSCRLNRDNNIKELPRKLIKRLSVDTFNEMKDSGNSAICCGNCAWTGCDSCTKALQVNRIRQAHDTGSNLLVTSCPKCQIHLKCAMEDPFRAKELNMEIMDLTSVIAETIDWE